MSTTVLKFYKFEVCSDETITTGYTPNVRVDGVQLSKAIKYAAKERLNAASKKPCLLRPN
jgi:hypothetical protein